MSNKGENMGVDAVLPENEEGENQDGQEDDEDGDVFPGEYEMLDAKLDDLNIALDLIEQKNDKIREEFLKLLHSNKQIREEFKDIQNQPDTNVNNEAAKANNGS